MQGWVKMIPFWAEGPWRCNSLRERMFVERLPVESWQRQDGAVEERELRGTFLHEGARPWTSSLRTESAVEVVIEMGVRLCGAWLDQELQQSRTEEFVMGSRELDASK